MLSFPHWAEDISCECEIFGEYATVSTFLSTFLMPDSPRCRSIKQAVEMAKAQMKVAEELQDPVLAVK